MISIKKNYPLVGVFLSVFLAFGCAQDDENVVINPGSNDSTIIDKVSDLLTNEYEIYVSDAGKFENPPWRIIKYDHNGENPLTFINTNLGWPQDILFLESQGEVLISNLNSGLINRHNSTTGAYIGPFAEGIDGPTRMKVGPDGLLYVLQWGLGKVLRYDLNGDFIDEFTQTNLSQSIGMDWDAEGNLYVSSFERNTVTRFDPDGKSLGTFASTNLQGPTNLWFGPDGDLFVNNWSGGFVTQYNPTGDFLGIQTRGLKEVEGVVSLQTGGQLVGVGGSSSVKYIDENGELQGDFILPKTGGLLKPNAVVLRKK